MLTITVDRDKCTGCGRCRQICPKGPLIWVKKDVRGKTIYEPDDLSHCLACRFCAGACPVGAIDIK